MPGQTKLDNKQWVTVGDNRVRASHVAKSGGYDSATATEIIDYLSVLSDLKYKRSELDKAIAHLDTIMSIRKVDIANLGVYEGAIHLLAQKGATMKTADIVDNIINSGKKFASINPKASIPPTLYKAVKEKKDCRLKKVGNGEWGLADWSPPKQQCNNNN